MPIMEGHLLNTSSLLTGAPTSHLQWRILRLPLDEAQWSSRHSAGKRQGGHSVASCRPYLDREVLSYNNKSPGIMKWCSREWTNTNTPTHRPRACPHILAWVCIHKTVFENSVFNQTKIKNTFLLQDNSIKAEAALIKRFLKLKIYNTLSRSRLGNGVSWSATKHY